MHTGSSGGEKTTEAEGRLIALHNLSYFKELAGTFTEALSVSDSYECLRRYSVFLRNQISLYEYLVAVPKSGNFTDEQRLQRVKDRLAMFRVVLEEFDGFLADGYHRIHVTSGMIAVEKSDWKEATEGAYCQSWIGDFKTITRFADYARKKIKNLKARALGYAR